MSKNKKKVGQLIKIINLDGMKYDVILGGLTKKGNPSAKNNCLIASGAKAIIIKKIRVNKINSAIIFVNNMCGWIFSNEYITIEE